MFISADDRRIQLERKAVYLSKHCPVDRSNPESCPLFGLRPLFVRDKRAWIHSLTVEELEYLVSYHACCVVEMKGARVAS